MLTAVIICFVLCYIAIVLEHPLKLDKTVPALIGGALCWGLISMGELELVNHLHQKAALNDVLLHHIGKVAEILVFLIGAMVIVELIDLHQGFSVITNRILTTSKLAMLWLVCGLSFFLSAILDNLTCTIVMISLLRKLVPHHRERLWFIGFIIIAANAGGAWSPIGDVTTTMLWIGEKVTTAGLIVHLFIPSAVCVVVPLAIASVRPQFKGKISLHEGDEFGKAEEQLLSSKTMLVVGIGGLIFVPIFKTITHLPPYVGMMLSMGVVWLISEYLHPSEKFTEERKHMYTARYALSRIEMSSILFFLGILFSVAALESVVAAYHPNGDPVGWLRLMAEKLEAVIPNQDAVVLLFGVFSAVIDNVPLVAATMGMYAPEAFPLDSKLWQFIAYASGTGGSMLIIGSAAGVAAMGMERIDFIWFFKNVSWLAAIGYLCGGLSFILLFPFLK